MKRFRLSKPLSHSETTVSGGSKLEHYGGLAGSIQSRLSLSKCIKCNTTLYSSIICPNSADELFECTHTWANIIPNTIFIPVDRNSVQMTNLLLPYMQRWPIPHYYLTLVTTDVSQLIDLNQLWTSFDAWPSMYLYSLWGKQHGGEPYVWSKSLNDCPPKKKLTCIFYGDSKKNE